MEKPTTVKRGGSKMIIQWKKIICILVINFAVLASFHLAGAQQAKKYSRIGFLGQGKPFLYTARIKALQQGLGEFGYVDEKNIRFEYRYAEGKSERLPSLAAELVGLEVDVMITTGTPSTRAAKKASNTIPIVMHGGDPVGTGLVASLAHPGGNITGLTIYSGFEFYGRRLELLKQVAPSASQFAVLLNPANSAHHLALKELQAAATELNVTLRPLEVKGSDDIDRAFDMMRKERPGAMLNFGASVFNMHRKRIAAFAIDNRLPANYTHERYVEAGGLMSYGVNMVDLYRRMGIYAGKILKGAKPADLPVEQPMKFDLVINLKTAEKIGVTIPPEVLLQATKVIQ